MKIFVGIFINYIDKKKKNRNDDVYYLMERQFYSKNVLFFMNFFSFRSKSITYDNNNY